MGIFQHDHRPIRRWRNLSGFRQQQHWAHGQAWAIYSFSDIAKTTGQADILAGAQKVADYFLAHLPSDSVPSWDFNDPKHPQHVPRLFRSGGGGRWIDPTQHAGQRPHRSGEISRRTEKILTSLSSSKYLAANTTSHGILLHRAHKNVPNDSKGNDVSLTLGIIISWMRSIGIERCHKDIMRETGNA